MAATGSPGRSEQGWCGAWARLPEWYRFWDNDQLLSGGCRSAIVVEDQLEVVIDSVRSKGYCRVVIGGVRTKCRCRGLSRSSMW